MRSTLTTLFALALFAATANAATILVSNTFEGGTMEDWSTTNASDAGLYHNGDVVVNMGAGEALYAFLCQLADWVCALSVIR